MPGGHVCPVKVIPCIKVPQRSHHPFAVSLLVHVDAARGRQFDIVYELLNLEVMDERLYVKHRIHFRVVPVANRILKFGKDISDGVTDGRRQHVIVRILHRHGHVIDRRPEVILFIGGFPGTVVHVQRHKNALFIAHLYPIASLLDLLGQLIDALIIPVDKEFHIAGVISIRQS